MFYRLVTPTLSSPSPLLAAAEVENQASSSALSVMQQMLLDLKTCEASMGDKLDHEKAYAACSQALQRIRHTLLVNPTLNQFLLGTLSVPEEEAAELVKTVKDCQGHIRRLFHHSLPSHIAVKTHPAEYTHILSDLWRMLLGSTHPAWSSPETTPVQKMFGFLHLSHEEEAAHILNLAWSAFMYMKLYENKPENSP